MLAKVCLLERVLFALFVVEAVLNTHAERSGVGGQPQVVVVVQQRAQLGIFIAHYYTEQLPSKNHHLLPLEADPCKLPLLLINSSCARKLVGILV